MYPCLLLKVLAEYELQLCACSKKRLLCACVPVRLAKGYTPRLHLKGGGGEGRGSIRKSQVRHKDKPGSHKESEKIPCPYMGKSGA